MPQKLITFPQPLVLQRAGMNIEAIKYFDRLRQSIRLITADSTAGNLSVQLPDCSLEQNQGIWVAIVKISADGNNVTAVRTGSNLINSVGAWGATSLLVGAAQGSHKIFGNDAHANWMQIA